MKDQKTDRSLQQSTEHTSEKGLNQIEAGYLRGVDAVIKAPLPVSSHYMILSFFMFFVVTVCWASFSEIDIVSSAMGKSVPSSRIQLIQAPQLALIESIYVKEGQHVSKGELLVKLDGKRLDSEYRDSQSRSLQLLARKNRIETLIAAVEKGLKIDTYPEPENTLEKMEFYLLRDSWAMYQSELASMTNKLESKQASLNRIKADSVRMKKLIPFSRNNLHRSETLYKKGGISLGELDASREALVERESSLEVLKQQRAEARAELSQSRHDLKAFTERFVNDLSVERVETEQALSQVKEETLRADVQISQFELRAPVTGIVKDVVVNTLGGVVQAAETLMRIVPENVPLEIEAKVLNRDIGFIYEGQQVKVKVDTFNFTKYGAIPGVIRYLAQDTTDDEQLGPVYLALIELERDTIQVGDRSAKLVPGMTMMVDIHVGERKLIEYILNPVLRYRDEVMRER